MDASSRANILYHGVFSRIMAIPARQHSNDGVTVAQIKALYALEYKQSASLRELAEVLGVTQPAASEIIDKLVRNGLVKRVQASKDRRRVVLTLRPKGERILERFARQRHERFRKLQRVVGLYDMRRMVNALQTVNDVLSKWPRD